MLTTLQAASLTRESDILAACLQWLTVKRVFHWRQNQGAIPLPGGKGYRKFVGMKGLPDILAVIPCEAYLSAEAVDQVNLGVFCGIEVKRPREKPRPEQQAFLDRLKGLGGIAIVAHSVDELAEQLTPWLTPEATHVD